MSKSSLKKELKNFTSEQLSEVIINIYNVSKEAKAYLEFFINPDPEAFLKKKFDEIFAEIKRTKHGVSKGRISVVRNIIKQGIGYGLSPEYQERLMFGAIKLILSADRYMYLSSALYSGTLKLTVDFITWANKNGMFGEAVSHIHTLVTDTQIGTAQFRNAIDSAASECIGNLKSAGL